MKTKKLSISFSEHYADDVYNYLKSKTNISLFVCELVKNEMNNKNTASPELEIKIEELIKKVLKENNHSFDSSSQTATSKTLSNDDKSLIKDLF